MIEKSEFGFMVEVTLAVKMSFSKNPQDLWRKQSLPTFNFIWKVEDDLDFSLSGFQYTLNSSFNL